MVSFKKSVLTALLFVSGLLVTGCATTPQESSELDKVHNARMMRVVERAEGPLHRFNQ